MIQEVNRDILSVNCGLICQQTNCIGAIGGLAGAIANKWENAANEYLSLVDKNKGEEWNLLGNYQTIRVGQNLRVLNIFGQYDICSYERRTEYGSLKNALEKIEQDEFVGDDVSLEFFFTGDEKVTNFITDVYIPYGIGCGLGGGDWKIVSGIINDVFKNSNKNVHICKI
jgi:hypothetical protein